MGEQSVQGVHVSVGFSFTLGICAYHFCVCFSLLHLDIFPLQQKCVVFFPMPLLFVLTLPQLCVAQRVSTVLRMLVCSVAEVSLGKKLGHWRLDGVQVCTLVCLFVLDLLVGLGFWFGVFFVGFFQCVCTQKGRIFRKPLVLLGSVYILSSHINQITNF